MFVCALASCSDGGGEDPANPTPKPEVVTPEITINADVLTNGLSFGTEAGETTLTFSTNVDWTLSIASTAGGTVWCKASVSGGSKGSVTVKFTVTEHTDYDDRSVSVTIKAGTASKTFTITQKCVEALLLTTDKYEVAQDGGTIEVEVKANIDYEVTISETAKNWITASESKSRALTTRKHTFTIAASEEAEKREGEITFKSGDKVETVKVYQAGGAIILLTKDEYTVSDAGETISVDIKSNVEYGVQMPDVDWITVEASSRGMSSHTLKYNIIYNNTNESRSAQIIFYDKNSSLKEVLTIIQKKKDLYVLKMDKAGTLKESLGDKFYSINSMKIIGDLNGNDIYYLRQMAGYKYNAQAPVGTLNYIDLSEASIVSGGDYYYSIFSEKKFTEDNKIGNYMFYECDSLCMINLPNNVISIGTNAFSGCENLHEITIPKTVTAIYYGAFEDCKKLKEITLPENLTILKDAFSFSGITEIIIPGRITELNDNIFYGCYDLKNITLPDSVSKIGYCAFHSCTSLTEIDLHKVTYIREKAFEGCSNLEKVKALSINTIDKYAFSKCQKIKYIYLGENTTSLGSGAFEDVTNDVTVFCYAKEPPTGCPFHKFMSSSCLYVPARCGTLYANSVWGNYFYNKIIEMDK